MMTYEESLTWNQDGYNEAISRRNPEYRISIEEFREWLTNNNEWAGFTASMNNPFNSLVDIAFDYSIPITMVKYFKTA